MIKIAIFVEGQTDQIFSEKLIKEYLSNHGFSIENYKLLGGKNKERKPILVNFNNTNGNPEYYFVIYDCGGDNKVQSDIRDRLDSLVEESFSIVIGVRDIYPENDISMLKHYLYFGIPERQNIQTKIILADKEIEAWFIAEEKHYPHINNRLTYEIANDISGVDVSKDDTAAIPHPSETLKQVYMRGGTTYDKSKEKVQRTVDVLNYENLYINVRKRNNSLNELLTCLDGFMP